MHDLIVITNVRTNHVGYGVTYRGRSRAGNRCQQTELLFDGDPCTIDTIHALLLYWLPTAVDASHEEVWEQYPINKYRYVKQAQLTKV